MYKTKQEITSKNVGSSLRTTNRNNVSNEVNRNRIRRDNLGIYLYKILKSDIL